ncbi:MAG TPA: FKBP-type peptidyl-prolyl cis-trans isomerase [Thermoanaerobaculia bacterium]|nr:FKBP-type peptidyl-prolyl cis-trans isomerase [Thermoanaerobaculia bacterium]
MRTPTSHRTKLLPFGTMLLLAVALFAPPAGPARPGAQEGIEAPPAPAPAPAPQAPAAPADLSPPVGAQTTGSGLAYQVLEEGTGANQPDGNDLVVVHYSGWKAEDGTLFDSSVVRGKPALLPLEALIQGWTEGLQLMTQGAKWRLWIPGELAYAGIEGRPQGMLVFDVELLEVRRIPEVPEHLAEPPPDAIRSRSGLAWKVLKPGTGATSPGRGDTVRVHYIGWNTGGQWFDSTYAKGAPADLPFDKVIQGWQEGLAGMVPGETRRLWIPDRLAYAGEAGKPQGPLTFDVELLAINPGA